ncbi:Sporulation initiation phosphotransferase F [Geobacillus sp. BCO2]|nr:Sporulation initiation phosphotransferase F [Geobacillus sp. BCO2]
MGNKILIVDDQYGIRILLNEVFQREGYVTYQPPTACRRLKSPANITRSCAS